MDNKSTLSGDRKHPRVLFVATEDWYFCSHRLPLAEWLIEKGAGVSVATSSGTKSGIIRSAGIEHHVVRLKRASYNPLSEWNAVRDIAAVCRQVRPDILHLVGLKPILYGTIAARRTRVRSTICAISGLGSLFAPGGMSRRLLQTIVRQCYRRYVYGQPKVRVIVQNPDDRDQLVAKEMVLPTQAVIINGSGVDLQKYKYTPDPSGEPIVFTHSRMLWDKGIGQLVEAARLLRQRGVACRFVLAGLPDPANPTSIPAEQLQRWHDEGIVEWLGKRGDIPKLLNRSHIACLPSYYGEGIPLSLIESAAAGRPIITTDMPGCREMVSQSLNGRIVPPRKVVPLADAIEELVGNHSLRQKMGVESRRLAESKYGIDAVREATWQLYQQSLSRPSSPHATRVECPAQKAAA
ncbi:N,N'-diacetylbacillosaminyl-diphospho-undecaprenol alpha-1,3-N-acetylgalactosaminyltransferase [Rosistilla carotiformis]|uniref:N, N'-diacetylbacillosaminyl-diphospho-undecaprenol alpha-1,3-N-acetylgalactosaminyltransferase n=1 Tax=Rosistilla carotiformis TaxID=2528017 RepID=A0A518JP14_9BACT|nr:glycosyltransferase family 4 protein [Rosistilla carotiformis]QDV67261.1 N,N'-diacetylbacillosaminyl-diphospho-undecaprenol alpha-1,3-N-acetylgalactosaminyltransferase [Rosistilla carotiformis]